MKQLSLIVIFLLSAISVYCADAGKLTIYYKNIYSAEKKLLNADYKGATADYDKAFNLGIIPFAADIYNNMLAGINTSDNSRILRMAKMLVLKGADTGYFRQCIFTSFRKSKEWNQLLAAYPALKKEREQKIDKKLIRLINDMVAKDQKAAHVHQDIRRKTTSPGNFNEKAELDFNKTEDSVFIILKNLMLNNDYLSEEKIGANIVDTEIGMLIYDVVMLHSFQLHDSSVLLDVLKTAIHSGKLRSGNAMNYLSISNPYRISYLNDYYGFKDTLFQSKYALQNIPDNTKALHLLSDHPIKEEKEFTTYCYMDTPENIVNKVKYHFRLIMSLMKGNPPNPYKLFVFGPAMSHVVGDGNRPAQYKDDIVIDICK